ncbi:CPBP family intramembrane metalloprotease [Clostridium sp. SHJSY1]|uniref:CPBP family intramembrane glutamic endopeptidase n=1 Tax=Clostridium sp. SHJSY1 TaxID=2942483 RepID=UPI0028768964|nr:type II CAAX endopeptidase family protein [Clostridium sp. SHJSY1]MDS0528495.1 CPBP family intramembrane metalloprotease [Clostridium sp. SHJSY1]
MKKLIIPILWEWLFIISCFVLPEKHYPYTNFLFYLGIIIYFILNGEFSFKELKYNINNGKKFWIPVFVTILFLILAFGVSYLPEMFFHNLNEGMINLRVNTWSGVLLFVVSTIIFPPLAEEMFYRKAIISFKNKKTLYISTIISLFLFAVEHSLSLYGIFMVMIWGIPFSISFIKTKNMYVPMMAHFIVNLIGNGSTAIIMIIHLLK